MVVGLVMFSAMIGGLSAICSLVLGGTLVAAVGVYLVVGAVTAAMLIARMIVAELRRDPALAGLAQATGRSAGVA